MRVATVAFALFLQNSNVSARFLKGQAKFSAEVVPLHRLMQEIANTTIAEATATDELIPVADETEQPAEMVMNQPEAPPSLFPYQSEAPKAPADETEQPAAPAVDESEAPEAPVVTAFNAEKPEAPAVISDEPEAVAPVAAEPAQPEADNSEAPAAPATDQPEAEAPAADETEQPAEPAADQPAAPEAPAADESGEPEVPAADEAGQPVAPVADESPVPTETIYKTAFNGNDFSSQELECASEISGLLANAEVEEKLDEYYEAMCKATQSKDLYELDCDGKPLDSIHASQTCEDNGGKYFVGDFALVCPDESVTSVYHSTPVCIGNSCDLTNPAFKVQTANGCNIVVNWTP